MNRNREDVSSRTEADAAEFERHRGRSYDSVPEPLPGEYEEK